MHLLTNEAGIWYAWIMKNNEMILHIPSDSQKLPDNDQWTHRFEIHSETSNRVYIVSQNKANRHWGCSCMAWRTRRYCKHLTCLSLPCHEVPFEVQLAGGR